MNVEGVRIVDVPWIWLIETVDNCGVGAVVFIERHLVPATSSNPDYNWKASDENGVYSFIRSLACLYSFLDQRVICATH